MAAVLPKRLYACKIDEAFYLSDERPRTSIGPQGDHITAYNLFKEYIRILENTPSEEVIARLHIAISSLADSYRHYRLLFSDIYTPDELSKIDDKIKNIEADIQEAFEESTKSSQLPLTKEDIEAAKRIMADEKI